MKYFSVKGPQDFLSRELMISRLAQDYITRAKTLGSHVLMIAFPEPGVEPFDSSVLHEPSLYKVVHSNVCDIENIM